MEEQKEPMEFKYSLRRYRLKPNHYKITCSTHAHAPVGFVWFELNNKKICLHNIFVEKQYRRFQIGDKKYHIGSTLLSIMENFAKSHNIHLIEGKFYPSIEGARDFYEKNGYVVPNATRTWANYDETWTLYKDLHQTISPKTTFTNEMSK